MLAPVALSGTNTALIVIGAVALLIALLWRRLRKVLDEGEDEPGGSMGHQMTDSLEEKKPEDFP